MKKSLAATNPYLRNPAKRAELIRRSATSSTAVEGVHIKTVKAKPAKCSRKVTDKS